MELVMKVVFAALMSIDLMKYVSAAVVVGVLWRSGDGESETAKDSMMSEMHEVGGVVDTMGYQERVRM
jgi:hypothetical protein